MVNQRGRPMKARPRILQTARELFLQHGLDVSLDTIAAEAGATRPTLYSHFPGGKDALLLETFAFLNDTMQPPLRQLLQERQQDFPALLHGFANVVQQHFYAPENIHFQRLLIQVLVQKPELYVTLEQRPSGRVLQALSEILAQKRDEGLLTINDPELQATAFLGAIMGYPLPGALIAQKAIDPKRLEQLADCAIEGFLKAWGYKP
ncbi:TPA: TetR/AcrR family transcriptional regulator [Klebsiella aerogenes]|uniref:TetR family transcriptional regulator n=1 Tax=Klebsiella aerogenes (strain ATCC 13048 / DSM 30053 / CCUG 1429 / JCM 1235 / KCTC 2190 / NBRC 13534 / NCIMB 10102 / NCTC 10006 / CDC 819-56) TaxID=1028307 RepID=A0A0H3FW10_KLEAK|nr:TetR/AcrR family transcriptional regulator [Klebsiella aerogenes]AEG98721.1 TetR family transcriptional regulator [Klebsiella aerogenes KCTC 2190]MEC4757138.1 TetR/AcrR family transcriptional regulator [Klebsiella aerogenes]QEU18468.1 TetR/AcrR family transcriptional regulator [Klebsiella aerogenes]QXB12318.1 TetR/AcrR family transcriptional regulator [Klebsiella aerogenes]RFP76376.1 TetR/AcrR family transcriptional regulator [Klebsiella aerogenes]